MLLTKLIEIPKLLKTSKIIKISSKIKKIYEKLIYKIFVQYILFITNFNFNKIVYYYNTRIINYIFVILKLKYVF